MSANLFDVLDWVSALVDEGKPDEAYLVMKKTIEEDTHGFALSFLAAWLEHLAAEDEHIQKKYEEIVLYLKEDFKELANVGAGPEYEEQHHVEEATAPIPVLETSPEPAPQHEEVEPPVVKPEEPELAQPEPEQAAPEEESTPKYIVEPVVEREPLTLTFYDWQMQAIHRAAHKLAVDDSVLLTHVLETGDVKPLLFSRYKQGSSSPSRRITISLAGEARKSLESRKELEGIKTTTKYVRKMLFGNRAEKY